MEDTDTSSAPSLADYIKARRERLGLSQADVAARAEMSQPHLSEIERGKIALPGPDLRRRIAAALRVTHADLLVAAGELLPDELAVSPEPTDPPDVARLVELVRSVPLSPRQKAYLRQTLEHWARHPDPDATPQAAAAGTGS